MPDKTLLVQLPLNQQAPLEPTGNTPLAGAMLVAASGLDNVSILDQNTSDLLGDRALVESIVSLSPDRIGFTLYCWNVERTLRLAGELNNLMPGVELMAGGPEVTEDNTWLLENSIFDIMLAGEGEPVAAQLFGPSFKTLQSGQMSPIQKSSSNLPPGTWPDPYLSGILDPAAGEPVLIETIRGCPSLCGYCAYRRSHPLQRVMPAEDALNLLHELSEAGAEEMIFLDPTFNARPDLEYLLRGMRDVPLKCFGEMRGETITAELAAAISNAGFSSVEIGLQSINPEVLQRSGRFGDPMAVLRGAAMLRSEGVIPVLDLILGLPGDTPEGAIRAAEVIREMDLHESVQVFHLAMLPGTESGSHSRETMPLPPYYRFRPPEMGGWAETRETIADILGYDLDLAPRPLLFEGWPGTIKVDLDSAHEQPLPDIPSYRHSVLRVRSRDLWEKRNLIFAAVKRRIDEEPHCILDIVLEAESTFPIDLISAIRRLSEPNDYSSRAASALARDGNLRVSVLIGNWRGMAIDWMTAISVECPLILDVQYPGELPSHLLEAGALVRLDGDDCELDILEHSVPSPHQLLFTSRIMEEKWSIRTLGALCN